MDYKIKIDAFEGPLDLLLHLIKESNIDIYDINIEEITKQYFSGRSVTAPIFLICT